MVAICHNMHSATPGNGPTIPLSGEICLTAFGWGSITSCTDDALTSNAGGDPSIILILNRALHEARQSDGCGLFLYTKRLGRAGLGARQKNV